MDKDIIIHKFPQPQYLGSKYLLQEWIAGHIPNDAHTVLDAFAGSQSVVYKMKQMGKRVLTNDFLKFNSLIGKALIENNQHTLSDGDTNILFQPNNDEGKFGLMENLYTNLFFTREEAQFLDSFRSNVQFLNNPHKEALALSIMCRSMTRKVTMGHFAHTKAMEYARDPKRIKRNRSLAKPIREIFLELLPQYNNAVFDNGEDNISYNEDTLELLPTLSDVDLVYYDPPYCNSHANYQSFYHLLETYVEYWKDKEFINGTRRYFPYKHSGFDKKKEALGSLKRLFELSADIPYWIVSYNDRSFPDIDTMAELIRPYRNVTIERKEYANSRGGKGSVKGSVEVLLICKP